MRYIFTFVIAFLFVSCNTESGTKNGINKSSISKDFNEIRIYFSKTSGNYSGGVDEKIIEDIKNSKEYINLAIYQFTSRDISNALIDAYNRGVDVRVITDDKSYSKSYYMFDELVDAGVDVKTDDSFSKGLMHDKFLIIDGKVVWSGSGNYTYYAFYRNYENYVRVSNKKIVNHYKAEFNEMIDGVLVKGSFVSKSYELYFSPEDNFRESRLLSLVKGAKESIYIMAFALNDRELKDSLIEAKKRGVDIYIIFDKEQTKGYQKNYTQYYALKDAGLDVVLVGSRNHKMHNKVIVVDEHITLTGSYNFTLNANSKNCENELIIISRDIAKIYIDNFKYIYNNK